MSQLSRVLVVGFLVCSTVVITSGCVVSARTRPVGYVYTSGEVYASTPMPPPRVEVVSVAPGPNYVYVQGYWGWDRGQWVWNSGRYVSQRPGYVWVAPQYVYRGGRHVYVAGTWRGGQGRGRVVVRPQQQRRAPPPPARSATPHRAPPPPAVRGH